MTKPSLDISIVIVAAPAQVLKAFFDADALRAWWQVAHSLTTPRVLGPYAIEWNPTDFRDEVLGRLGGVFRGSGAGDGRDASLRAAYSTLISIETV